MSVHTEHDAALSFRIVELAEARLMASSHPALHRIFCSYQQGALLLQGRVQSFYHSQLAQEAVAGIDGVERVVNRIEVI